MSPVETELLAIALYESQQRYDEDRNASSWMELGKENRAVWRDRARNLAEEFETP